MAKASKTNERSKKALFELPAPLLRKLKYIALVDETTQVNIVQASITEYIAKWEKKHGPISIK